MGRPKGSKNKSPCSGGGCYDSSSDSDCFECPYVPKKKKSTKSKTSSKSKSKSKTTKKKSRKESSSSCDCSDCCSDSSDSSDDCCSAPRRRGRNSCC